MTKRKVQSVEIMAIPDAHIGIDVVVQVTGKSSTTIMRMVARGEFPAPHYSGHSRFWVVREVLEWLEQEVKRAPLAPTKLPPQPVKPPRAAR